MYSPPPPCEGFLLWAFTSPGEAGTPIPQAWAIIYIPLLEERLGPEYPALGSQDPRSQTWTGMRTLGFYKYYAQDRLCFIFLVSLVLGFLGNRVGVSKDMEGSTVCLPAYEWD